jgi:hypothetical protein
MNLSSVATAPGGAAQSAVTTWTVAAPVTRGYETVLYLRFPTQSATDGLEIDAAACQLEGSFLTFDYNALNAPPVPAAQLSMSKDGKAVIVKLDGPRLVLSIGTSPSISIDLHRADGVVQADKGADSSNFTDVNFGVQPTDSSATIGTANVTAVNVRGNPSSPRMGIAATDLKTPTMFWPTPDAAGQNAVHAGAAFGKALQAFVATQPMQQPPPDHLDVALVIQSDAPCRLQISQFNVVFHRVLTSFTSGGDKQVLRYAGKNVERQSVSIQLPAGATVSSGTLRVNESFRPGSAAVTGDDVLAPAPIAQDRGVCISASGVQSGAQRVTPSGSLPAAGVALGLMALEPGTQLAIELQPDQGGLPTGQKLADASTSLDQAGQRLWAVASLKSPAALPGQPFWIVVSAVKGSAIWLAEPGSDPARLLQKTNGLWTEAARFDGFEAMTRVLPPAPASPSQPASPSPPRTNASIGSATLAGAVQTDGSRLFDVTSQLNAYLAAAHQQFPQAATASIPLVFTSGAAGQVIVYPPHIAYDV